MQHFSVSENTSFKVEVKTLIIRKKMAEMSNVLIVCSFCQEEVDQATIDSSEGLRSCPQCGSVLSEEQVFNYDLPHSENTRSKSTSFKSNRDEAIRHGPRYRPSFFLSAPQNAMKTLFVRLCGKLQLPKEIIDQGVDFLKANVFKDDIFPRMQRKIRLVGACIYIVSRNNGFIITLKQIAVAIGCSVYELGHIVKFIDSTFGLCRAPVTVESLIATCCCHLPMSKECEELAQGLYRRSRESLVLNGSQVPQAIAYCVLASLAVNKGTVQRQEIKNLCLKMSQVSEQTVLVCIRSLKNFIMALLKVIPWVNMKYVKMSNIHYYIKDIIKYEQNCGKISGKPAQPKWCRELENKILARKLKIENALERVRLRQSPVVYATPNNNSLNKEDSITDLNSSAASEATLDDEDRVIEELLELGCSPEQLQEGYYEDLRLISSPMNHEIADAEIESYVRNPDEINLLKRVLESEEDLELLGSEEKRSRQT